MTAPNKRRGNDFEREIVELAESHRLEAERAWGSDGRAMGHTADVDVLVAGYKGQAKRRKKDWPKWFRQDILPNETVDFQAVRCDRDKPYAILPLDAFFRILKLATLYGKEECND